MNRIILFTVVMMIFGSCKKTENSPVHHITINMKSIEINNVELNTLLHGVNILPDIKITFSAPVDEKSVASAITVLSDNAVVTPLLFTYLNNDSTVSLRSAFELKFLSRYSIKIDTSLKSSFGEGLFSATIKYFITQIDSSDKFPQISDSALLNLVQQQTFKYFWEFGHSVSGLARERTSSGDIVTTGGSGFSIMSILVGIQRDFISRASALTRIEKIISFLKNNVSRYHGAFPHWINGSTGATVPFSSSDDGGDIVETAYMMQGLLCARQYFTSTTDSGEINLRAVINDLYDAVQWNWYRQKNQNVLYWNWSPDYNWQINVRVGGWDEALITYVLAASSNVDTNTIPKIVYDSGWAENGAMKNGKSFFGIRLPLGPDFGGPLFFSHYSFLGINPQNLSDAYTNYWTQDTAHAKINYLYCVNNTLNYYGYSNLCWGLTASDEENGYSAHSPTNDDGVISPTAAISSLPFTPTESMNALRFFYYKLGDKTWGQYGFTDAFNLQNIWFDTDCLAIDQGPQIVMIENYRTGLLWNLFMSCPEVKRGMKKLGFQSPNLN